MISIWKYISFKLDFTLRKKKNWFEKSFRVKTKILRFSQKD